MCVRVRVKCVCACMCEHVHTSVHACMYVCENQELGVVPACLLGLSLGDYAWRPAQQALGFLLPVCMQHLAFLRGFFWELNSGPHADTANNILPTEPSPQPKRILSHIQWKHSRTDIFHVQHKKKTSSGPGVGCTSITRQPFPACV